MPHSTPPRRWFRLAAPLAVAALLILVSLPGMLDQVRDVDVLLYSAAAVRSNAEGALPYVAAWIEKGPLAMGLFQALFAVFGPYNPAAVWCLWLVMALAGAALAWGLAAEIAGPGAGAQSVRRAGAWAHGSRLP